MIGGVFYNILSFCKRAIKSLIKLHESTARERGEGMGESTI